MTVDLDDVFTYHKPNAEEVEQIERIRKAALNLAKVIVNNTPPSADQSAALRKVREASMTANASIVLKGKV